MKKSLNLSGYWISSCLLVLLSFGFLRLPAQEGNEIMKALAEENRQSIEALVLYPDEIRLAILEAGQYPEILVKMQNIRAQSQQKFVALIENYPRPEQELLYDLMRYPGLVHNLALHRNIPEEWPRLLEVLPQEKTPLAIRFLENHPDALQNMDALQQLTQGIFEQMTSGYPEKARRAFARLLEAPEVIDILNEDLRFTIMASDMYRENPEYVLRKIDSLHLEVARQQAAELASWKSSLENDPEAREEFSAAAKDYTAENHEADSEDYPYREQPAAEYHYYYPYPYWTGYPWWYEVPCWRPYPYWYDWGFYMAGDRIVVVFLPSYRFVHWYFRNPHNHHHYYHLSSRFVNHYYGFRRSGTTIAVGVGEWREQTRHLLSDEWLQDPKRLPERIREYGRFETEREQYNARHPSAPLSEADFLKKNARQYPDLEKSRIQSETRKEYTPAPARKTETPPPGDEKTRKPVERPQQAPAPKTVEPAKDYHQQKWRTIKPNPPVKKEPQPQKTEPARKKDPPARKPAPAKEKIKQPDQKKRGGGS